MNLLQAEISQSNGRLSARVGENELQLPAELLSRSPGVRHIEIGAQQLVSEDVLEGTVGEEERDALVGVGSDERHVTLIGRFSPDTSLNPGDTVRVGIDAARLHLFDLETGLVIRG